MINPVSRANATNVHQTVKTSAAPKPQPQQGAPLPPDTVSLKTASGDEGGSH